MKHAMLLLTFWTTIVAGRTEADAYFLVSAYRLDPDPTGHLDALIFNDVTGAFLRVEPDCLSICRTEASDPLPVLGPDGLIYAIQDGFGLIPDRIARFTPAGDFMDVFAEDFGGFGLRSIAFAGDGRLWAFSHPDRVFQFDDTGRVARSFSLHESFGGTANGMTVGPDGSLYLSGWLEPAIYKFDVTTGQFSTLTNILFDLPPGRRDVYTAHPQLWQDIQWIRAVPTPPTGVLLA
jgi:streptogramin lyase